MQLAAAEGSPQVTSILLPVVLVPAGIALFVVGYLAVTDRLARNRFAGVRTSETLRSEAAFRLANRVAAPTMLAAGVIMILAGALGPLLPQSAAAAMVTLVALVAAGVLVVTGGRRGHQLAREFNAQQPPPGGCGGCACGAGGCRGASVPGETANP